MTNNTTEAPAGDAREEAAKRMFYSCYPQGDWFCLPDTEASPHPTKGYYRRLARVAVPQSNARDKALEESRQIVLGLVDRPDAMVLRADVPTWNLAVRRCASAIFIRALKTAAPDEGKAKIGNGVRAPITHELKTWDLYFARVLDGSKTFEARKNDRDYRDGDTLLLRETEPDSGEYTGREISKRVGFVLDGPEFGVMEGHVIMSLATPNDAGGGKVAVPEEIPADVMEAAAHNLSAEFGPDFVRPLGPFVRALWSELVPYVRSLASVSPAPLSDEALRK